MMKGKTRLLISHAMTFNRLLIVTAAICQQNYSSSLRDLNIRHKVQPLERRTRLEIHF